MLRIVCAIQLCTEDDAAPGPLDIGCSADAVPNSRWIAMSNRTLVSLVISGGQTGADQGGLLGARDAGVRTGGTAPKGWRTEDGAALWLAEFGLVEARSKSYSARTRANAEMADGTVLFGNHLSTGSALTERCCSELGKQTLRIPFDGEDADVEDAARQLADWLRSQAINVLNVAGNRESGSPGIGDFVRRVVFRSLIYLKDSSPSVSKAGLDG